MKRLLGVVLGLFMACIPMNIHAQEVVESFEYTGQKIEVENAVKYYTIEGELLDEAPIYCGTYIAWTSDEEAILFEINPKKVPVKVTYNKDWRESDPEEEKYLCDYVGDYAFKLRIDTDGNINSLDNYQGNYDFQFEPKNVKDIEVAKTRITHPDVEYIYSEDGISIYSDIDHVKPIQLKDVGLESADSVKKLVSVTNESNTEIITISATTTDPKLSKDIANDTVSTFIRTMQKNLNVRNIEVVDKAKLSYIPSGPNVKKNTLLATMVGFVLGCGYATLRFLFDNRLRTKEEAEKYLGIPVFCEIPEL